MRRFIPPTVRSLDAAPPPPVVVEAAPADHGPALEAARAEGYAAGLRAGHATGFAEGSSAAHADAEAELAPLRAECEELRARDMMTAELRRLLEERTADQRALEDASRTAIAAALRALFPLLMNQAIGAEILQLVAESLTNRPAETLTLRASPGTLAAVTARGIPEADAARLVLQPDIHCPPAAAFLSWTGGGLTFDAEHLLRQVTDALSPKTIPQEDASYE